jgi:peptidoglycan hydrolase-like protein with peptidoglycan-binding domain
MTSPFTVLDEVLQTLLRAVGGTSLRGRLLDDIGEPVNAAQVAVRRAAAEGDHAVTTTDPQGTFVFTVPMPRRFLLVVRTAGRDRTVLQWENLPVDLGELRVDVPFVLAGSVGDGGANRPLDVRRVQDRLHRLGRLSDADVAAEPVVLAAVPPVAVGPRLLTAIIDHIYAAHGARARLITPASAAEGALAEGPPWPTVRLALGAPVGELPAPAVPVNPINAAADVRRVQDRLHQLGLLRADHRIAERPAVGAPAAPVGPRTLDAIVTFDRLVVGGSLHAVVPGRTGERALGETPWLGIVPLRLAGSVGVDGQNRPRDVRLVQDRLLRRGLLATADHAAEIVALAPPPAGPVAVGSIPLTIAAIAALRQQAEGGPAAAPARIETLSPVAAALDHPPALPTRLTPPILRQLQERMNALGLLADADLLTERIDPGAAALDMAIRPRTVRALDVGMAARGPLELGGGVGPGENNRPADVRLIQDRLAAVGPLAAADYLRERVDPALPGAVPDIVLGSTYTALTAFRRRVLGMPAAVVGREWTAIPVVRPGDDTHQLLEDPVYGGRFPLNLSRSVGRGGVNRPRDVRAVQARLQRNGALAADVLAELVDPDLAAPIDDSAIPLTIAAIERFQSDVVGEAAPVTGRVDPLSPALAALSNPIGLGRDPVPITGSVGLLGTNAVDDVRRVQGRLNELGYLLDADFEAEREVPPLGVAGAAVPATLAAIASWRRTVDAPAGQPMEPGDAAHRRLQWPLLPRPSALVLTASVGAGAAGNVAAEVRRVIDRLHELGYLDTAGYLAERGLAVPGAATLAAIRLVQQTVAGGAVDGVISLNGFVRKVLEDPTYATTTLSNPNAHFDGAGIGGIALAGFPIRLHAMIWSIEHHESGAANPADAGGVGEVPARSPNGAGIPASFGRVQMIGSSQVDLLGAHLPGARHYGLAAVTPALRLIATRTAARFNAIYALVPVGGLTANALSVQIANYAAANLPAFRTETGLSPRDLENMFHTAQLVRIRNAEVTAHPVPAGAAVGSAAYNAWLGARVAALAANADLAPALAALGLVGVLSTFVRDALLGEHRAAFATRALFCSEYGQQFRNSMTDNDGSFGRIFIQDNYGRVQAAQAAVPVVLSRDDEARITMRIHNSGAGALAGYVANPGTAVNGYVNAVLVFYNSFVANNMVP